MDFASLLQATVLFMVPIMLVALAGAFAEHSGIINLGLEGGMIFGAFIGIVVCRSIIKTSSSPLSHSQWVFVLGMLVAAAAGAVFSLLLSFAAIKLKADQTIAGTALNSLAPAIVCTFGLLLYTADKINGYTSFAITTNDYAAGFANAVRSNRFLGFFFDGIYISSYIGIAIYILLSIWLYKSKVGTHLRACGEHPGAADSVGINVSGMRYLGTTISGALSGLGGFIYVCTSAGGIAENSVGGLGFLALAIMIFGNWKPLTIALGALLFGFLGRLGVLAPQISWLNALGLPMYFYNIIPYVVVIIVLVLTRKKSGVPKAEGIPYDKGQR